MALSKQSRGELEAAKDEMQIPEKFIFLVFFQFIFFILRKHIRLATKTTLS